MSALMFQHEDWMQKALKLAEKGRGTTSPNPMVGCVVVKDGECLAEGYHVRAGESHAEVHALNAAGERAKGAFLYVTLEPCCHQGRTPPCVDRIIQSGVSEVIVACYDPNPLVAGKGVKALEAAGIQVRVGVCEAQAKQLNAIFFHYIRHQMPYVIAKWAMSLDGCLTVAPGDSKQISSEASWRDLHEKRAWVDAILVGANTFRDDAPSLTARGGKATRQALRIVVLGETPVNASAVLAFAQLGPCVFVSPIERADLPASVECWLLPDESGRQVDLKKLAKTLAEREVTSVLVEGGRKLHAAFFQANLVNQVMVYLAPVIVAGKPSKLKLSGVTEYVLGEDRYFEAEVKHV